MGEKMTFADFMRMKRLEAMEAGVINGEPGELERLRKNVKSRAEIRAREQQEKQTGGFGPDGVILPRGISSEEAAKAIQDMVERCDNSQSDEQEDGA